MPLIWTLILAFAFALPCLALHCLAFALMSLQPPPESLLNPTTALPVDPLQPLLSNPYTYCNFGVMDSHLEGGWEELPCIALHCPALPCLASLSQELFSTPPQPSPRTLLQPLLHMHRILCNSYAATFAVWLHIDWGGWEELPCIVLPSDLTFCFDDPALPMDPLLPLLCNFDAATFMLWLHILRRIESSVQAEPSYKRCNPAL